MRHRRYRYAPDTPPLTRTYQPCIEIYTVADYHAVVAQIDKEPDRRKADRAMHAFVGSAAETEIDKQGRVLLPQMLRKLARIETNACVVGQVKRLEIWSEEVWTAHITAGGDSEAAADAFSGIAR